METICLTISAGSGPEECAYAAALTLKILQKELKEQKDSDITIRIIETEPSCVKGNIRSALLMLEGKEARFYADSWMGIIQWIWHSAYRPHHKRKNWFVSVKPYIEPEAEKSFSPSDLRQSYWELERGNPIRVYDGETLKLLKRNSSQKGVKQNV